MKEQKKKQNGITLIALVISIIVMLILAGVSLNLTIGDNGIVTQAKVSILENKFAHYKEEMQMNLVQDINVEKINDKIDVTLMNEYVTKYIPSLEQQYIGKFAIVEGKLYYLGDDSLQVKAAQSQGIGVLENGESLDDYITKIESNAVEAVLKNMTGNSFVLTNAEENSSEVGVKLKDKTVVNNETENDNDEEEDLWKIIIEVNNNQTVATYGTGWTFVEAGQKVDGLGVLKRSYIIDYANRKKVVFDATKHTQLASGSNLAVKKDIVLNVDPLNLSDDGAWGSGVTLYGVSSQDFSNFYDGKQLNFDGIDDYLEINMGAIDLAKGITVEFYGKILQGSNSRNFFSKNVKKFNWLGWKTKNDGCIRWNRAF